MEKAIALAIENVQAGLGGPFGALVVKDGHLIAEGTNRVTTLHDPTAHAEVVAIREACRRLKSYQLEGCELYTSCEPCPMCMGAIYWARLERVYYAGTRADAAAAGFDDAYIYEELVKALDRRRLPMVPVKREDARRAFEAWSNYEGRVDY